MASFTRNASDLGLAVDAALRELLPLNQQGCQQLRSNMAGTPIASTLERVGRV